MVPKSIEAVLFDAVGTLIHSRGSVGEIYRNIAIKYGSDVPAETLQTGFLRETASHGTPVNQAGWKTLVHAVFLQHGPFPQFEEFFAEVYAFFQSGHSWKCYPETESVLTYLAKKHYRMAIVSNFDQRLFGILSDLGINQFFSAVVTPNFNGQAKPESGIFIDAITKLGVPPERALFVGDDPFLDFAGARTAGLKAILIDRESSNPPASSIKSLSELLQILNVD